MDELELKSVRQKFCEDGYVIIKAEDKSNLEKSRSLVAQFLRQKLNIQSNDDDSFILNNIHNLVEVNDAVANNIVLDSIQHYSKKMDLAKSIFSCNRTFLSSMLGPDICAQKHANIVFQYPHSKRNSELHYDAPPNSRYELVAWAPLVDCYGTKSFYVIDRQKSNRLFNEYNNDPSIKSWDDLKERALKQSIHIEIDYGEVLYFSANLFHGSLINISEESRWSLNTRYKNLFAPSGLKDPFTFYKVLETSPLTQIALEY